MKRQYESPKIKVIKYRKDVRTDQIEYVTSGDTTTTILSANCPDCGQKVSVSVPIYLDPNVQPTPAEMDMVNSAIQSAIDNHLKVCPGSN